MAVEKKQLKQIDELEKEINELKELYKALPSEEKKGMPGFIKRLGLPYPHK